MSASRHGWFDRRSTTAQRRNKAHLSSTFSAQDHDAQHQRLNSDRATLLSSEISTASAGYTVYSPGHSENADAPMALPERYDRDDEEGEDGGHRHRHRHRRHRRHGSDISPRLVRIYETGGSIRSNDRRTYPENLQYSGVSSGRWPLSARSISPRERSGDWDPQPSPRRHRSSRADYDARPLEPQAALRLSSPGRPPPASSRPPMQRSNTMTSRRSSWFPILPATSRDSVPQRSRARRASDVGTSVTPSDREGTYPPSERRSANGGILGALFSKPPPRGPVKRVECLTCMEDVPMTKAAKLECGHIMCHSCLRRIFNLSVTDPQHMPPKCCTAEHIPLRHVERLYTDSFKIRWNKKYQEYTTKNRVYCPTRGCGEWIKPSNIYTENGRKCAKCQRCRTKVCVLCNGRWHIKRECPRDEEVNRLVETAKQEGWQRCYNCRAMVELKEGCNHMTCRCRAEFCMICGSKWKTCNCPWFNHTVGADDADALRFADDDAGPAQPNHHFPGPPAPPPPAPVPAHNYEEELAYRRRQEREDEDLARRLQAVGFDDDVRHFQDAYGPTHGARYMTAAAHRREFPHPPPPPLPLMRSHTNASRQYNANPRTRPAERVVPRRETQSFASEFARHAPPPAAVKREPKLSELAGVTRPRSEGRVNAWLDHVEEPMMEGVAAS